MKKKTEQFAFPRYECKLKNNVIKTNFAVDVQLGHCFLVVIYSSSISAQVHFNKNFTRLTVCFHHCNSKTFYTRCSHVGNDEIK